MKTSAALGQAGTARDQSGDTEITIASTAIILPIASPAQVSAPDLVDIFRERCEACALLFVNGAVSLQDAVDRLQADAEQSGLVGRIGQDAVQSIMGDAFAAVRSLPEPAACEPAATPRPQSYRTAASTVDAFWFIVRLNDSARLKAWLADHPADVAALREILDGK